MRTWITETADIRADEKIGAAIAAFISDWHVKRMVNADRIIGCAHQEGIDYPMGRTCPRCPFWAGIDRFTHEPVRTLVPSMSAEEVLRTLAADPPDGHADALASADAHREALVAPSSTRLSAASPIRWRVERGRVDVSRTHSICWRSGVSRGPFRTCSAG